MIGTTCTPCSKTTDCMVGGSVCTEFNLATHTYVGSNFTTNTCVCTAATHRMIGTTCTACANATDYLNTNDFT